MDQRESARALPYSIPSIPSMRGQRVDGAAAEPVAPLRPTCARPAGLLRGLARRARAAYSEAAIEVRADLRESGAEIVLFRANHGDAH